MLLQPLACCVPQDFRPHSEDYLSRFREMIERKPETAEIEMATPPARFSMDEIRKTLLISKTILTSAK
jgi:hypothetical protein